MKNMRKKAMILVLLAIVLTFSLSACGNSPKPIEKPDKPASATKVPENTEESKLEATKPSSQTQEVAVDNQLFANLAPQVIYDENNIKVSVEVAPEKQPRTYQVTVVNGTDKTISFSLGGIMVEGIIIRMSLVDPKTDIMIRDIEAGKTMVGVISLQNLQDSFFANHYKDSGLGNLGDFETMVVIKDDALTLLFEPKVVSVKTDRGPTKPDLSLVTKNLMLDQEGIKLYLVQSFASEFDYRFVFFYENPHDVDVAMQSTVEKADGVEISTGPAGMYFEMPAKSKGFYEHITTKHIKAGVLEPKNFEAKLLFTDYNALNFETDFVSFNMDKFPPIKE